MAGLMDAWKNMRIKTKILIMYLTVVLLSFVITFSVISVINTSYTKREIMGAGTQTVSALKGNLSLIFDNVTQFSNLIYFDKNVQEALRNVDNRAIDPSIQRTIKQSLVNMILSGEYISSVLIMDSYHNVYSSYKKTPKGIYGEKILESEWYRHLSEHRGNGFFMKGSEGVIEFYGDTPYITYIREIRDENTYKPLAILLVTVNEETIRNYFNGVSNSSDSDFYILGDEGEYIVAPGNPGQRTGENRLVITQDIGIENWKLAGSFQLDNMTAMAPYYSTIILLIMCMNVAFVFVCSVMLTRFIFHPLLKVEKHMMLVEKGQFDEMEVDRQKNEINNLKRVFNHMARSINSLIQKVKEEEQIIAKVELDLLQAQINPHFLYNTLDAVSALALMQDYDNCFKMTQALGSFYRNSLNSGLDFITVKDEISCIQSYLTILNIRYDNEIKVEVDVEEEVKDCRILKLLLQPLVENAVHHGIKPREGKGTISIKAFSDEDEIIFLVSDDGVGMSEEKIEEIMEGKTVTGKSGFGLYNLKQRITLYHGIRQPVLIHSEIGNGTEIAVRVKRMEAKGCNMEIKVLIVDDEKLERVLIKRGFPWEDYGFSVIGEVSSGTEALEFIKYRKPELVLTDINMPHMDGLELAEHISALDESIHVIMITGYREFEYARRAVKLGVEDFLLKPIDMNELMEIALKIRGKIIKEKARRKEVEMLKQSVSADQDIIMESFFQRLVEKRTSEEEAEKKLLAYDCEAMLEGCCCLNIHLKEERSGEADGSLHKRALELLGRDPIDGTISFLHYMKNIILFCTVRRLKDSGKIAQQIHQRFKENHMVTTIGISRSHEGYEGIAEAFAESEHALSASVLLGDNRIITYEEYMHIMEKNPDKLAFDWEDFLFSLTNGISDRVSVAIEDYVEVVRNSRVTEVEYLRLTVMDLMSKAGSTLNKYGVSLEQLIGEDRLYESIQSIQTVEECRPFLEESIHMILNYHNSKKAKQGNKVVNEALEYIDKNFCDPALSLKTVASAVFSNESYLSRVFKKEAGQSLIEYVLKKRIEEGIRLLNTTDFKVYEIAEKVGFRDSHYFGICFKKHVGVTVKEYKQR